MSRHVFPVLWEHQQRRGQPDGHGNIWCQGCGGAAIAPSRGQTIFLCHGCKVPLPRALTAEEHEERARNLEAEAAYHRTCAASIAVGDRGTLWTTPTDPKHRALAKLDTTGSAAELARQIQSMPERNIARKVATFARKPLSPETLKKPTG